MNALIDRAVPVPGPPGPAGPAGPPGPTGPAGPPGSITPWNQNVDANTYNLSNVGRLTVLSGGITVGSATPVANSINITGQFLVNGVPVAGAGVSTPAIFSVNGTQIGTQPELNLIASSNVTLAGVNNTGLTRVDVTVSATVPVTSVNGHTGAVVITSTDTGSVPTTRQIIAGTGLASTPSGSDLSIDRTLSVVADTTVQQCRVSLAASLKGTRRELNFIQGSGILLAVTDDSVNNRVNISVTGTSGAAQTPWVTDIDGGTKTLFNVGRIGIGTSTPSASYALDVVGDINISSGSVYRINGVPLSTGGSQTPWTSDINAAFHILYSVGAGIGTGNVGGIGVGLTTPIYGIDVRNSGTTPAHFANNTGDAGMYLFSNTAARGSSALICGGCVYSSGSSFTAKDGTPSVFGDSGDYFLVTGDTGKTVGVTFVPTTQFVIVKSTGNVGIGNDTAPAEKLQINSTGHIAFISGDNYSYLSHFSIASGSDHVGLANNWKRTGLSTGSRWTSFGATSEVQLIAGYNPPYGQINLRTSGPSAAPVERLSVDYQGHVGINTTSPTYLMDIRHATDGALLHLAGNAGGDSGLYLVSIGGSSAVVGGGTMYDASIPAWVAKNANPSMFGDSSAGYFVICADSGKTIGATYTPSPRFVIDKTTGYVGAGPSAVPAQQLDINVPGATPVFGVVSAAGERFRFGFTGVSTSLPTNNIQAAQLLVDSTGNLLLSSRTNNASGIIFYTNSGVAASEWMRITSAGFVGIGNTPGHALDVTGDINCSGSFMVGGVPISGSQVVATVTVTNRTSSISTTNILVAGAMAPAGTYRISVYFCTRTAGAGNVNIIAAWFTPTSSNPTLGFGTQNLIAPLDMSTSAIAQVDGAHHITYQATYVTSGAYDIRIIVEHLI